MRTSAVVLGLLFVSVSAAHAQSFFGDTFESGDLCTWTVAPGCQRCGNNTLEGTEVCDDGNTVTETSCPYGTATCQACDATCKNVLNLTGAYCGDGMVNGGSEVCDDGNSLACGTCSADCTVFASAPATGSITFVAASGYVDGETFTINDGISAPTIFEFDPAHDGVAPGHVAITVSTGQSATTVASVAQTAIDNVGSSLLVTASFNATATVALSHDRSTSLGNQPITETVANAGFGVSGMSGGAGGDCPSGTGCIGNADCASYVCTSGTCN